MSDYSAREQRGWYMYDFANSAFSTTVVTLFLGPYLTVLAKAAADAHGMVHPLRLDIDARSYWSYLISLSVILQVLFLPMLGAVADYSRRKRELLGLITYIGAGATIAMFFLQGRPIPAGRHAVPYRQCELWRGRRDLQLLLAGNRAPRRPRRCVVEGLGDGLCGRRHAARTEPAAVPQCKPDRHERLDGGSNQPLLGGRLVGAVHRSDAGAAPQSRSGAPVGGWTERHRQPWSGNWRTPSARCGVIRRPCDS